MGVVYLARDPFIQREVAIKLLRSIDDDEAHERFQREIRIAGALSHPNIVRIYDAGAHDGQPFVAMEYVNGQTLAEVIKAGVPLELDRKIEMMLDLADGLGYAHKRGVIHRDIKPSNLIIDEHGALKILDFGIARLSDAGRTSLSAVGTPSYMAPEQILGETVDARCDLFSFGVVVYEVVAYRQPFTGDTEHSVYHRILNAQPRPITEAAPGSPPSLDAFMATALAKRPDERFQTAKALADELRAIRGALTADETIVVARPKGRPAAAAPTPLATPQAPTQGSGGTAQRSPASRRLADLRERQSTAAKEDARRALAEGRAQEALEAAERALVLDEQDATAHQLADAARQAIDREEARQAIAQAEQLLLDGQLTRARQVVEHARAQLPHDEALAALEQRVLQAAREREAAARRAAQVREAIEHARRCFEQGDLETAAHSVAEALAVEPGNGEANEVRAAIEAAQRTRQAEAQWHDAARQACARARELSARHAGAEAITLLERFSPPHPIVTGLIAELRNREAVIAEQQRRQQAEARRAQERARGLAEATRLLSARDAVGALRALAELRGAGIVDDEVVGLEQQAADLRLAQAQQRRREAMLARGVETARALVTAGDPDAALLALDQLESDGVAADVLAPLRREAAALQQRQERERQQQIDRERRAARLADDVARVKSALDQRDADAALAALGLLRRDGFDAPELKSLESTAQALRQALARERQQQIERDRHAARLAAGIADVRSALQQHDPDAAIAAIVLLSRDGFDTPEVAALEAEARAMQDRLAEQRQQHIAQQRRGARLARGVAEIGDALAKRDADAAAAALSLLERDGFSAEELAPHAREVRALQEQVDAERRAQIERDRRAARLTRGLVEARTALQQRAPSRALEALAALEQEKLESAEIATLKKEAKALEKQLERERKEAAAAAASVSAASGGLSEARPLVATEPWARPARGPSTTRLPLLVGAAALVLVVFGGGVWMLVGRGGAPASQGEQNEPITAEPGPSGIAGDAPTPASAGTVAQASDTVPTDDRTPEPPASSDVAGPSTAAPTAASAGGSPPAPGTTTTTTTSAAASEASRLIGESVRLEARGDYRQAAALLGKVLSSAPGASTEARSANARLRTMTSGARQRATRARDRAEQANAVGNDEYMGAARAFTQGQQLAQREPEQAIGRFLDAEAGFDRARALAASAPPADARPTQPTTQVAQVPPVVRPVPEIPREVPREPAARPAEPAPPKPAAPAPAPPTTPATPDTSADQRLVESVVRRYFAARSSLNLTEVQQVYPGVPAGRERDTLRAIDRACETFTEQPSEVSVMSVNAQEAVVRSRAQTTCKQKAGGREVKSPVFEVYITLRKSGAAWQIAQVNRPDQAR